MHARRPGDCRSVQAAAKPSSPVRVVTEYCPGPGSSNLIEPFPAALSATTRPEEAAAVAKRAPNAVRDFSCSVAAAVSSVRWSASRILLSDRRPSALPTPLVTPTAPS
ncbi:hypothetical protein MTO96_007383 [Rhipicephalus appendiculatus]